MSPSRYRESDALRQISKLRIALVRSSPQMVRACLRLERKMLSNECYSEVFATVGSVQRTVRRNAPPVAASSFTANIFSLHVVLHCAKKGAWRLIRH